MFGIVRLIIGLVLIRFSITATKNPKINHKHIKRTILIISSIALTCILAFLPFENLFITFSSPNAAYKYYNLGKNNIALIIEGTNSDFVIDRQRPSDTYLIIPKTTDGWKIGTALDTRIIVQEVSDEITIYVYQYKETDDYYITVLNTSGGELIVSDIYNSKFYSLSKDNEHLGKTFVTYYAHISNLNPQYSLVVNGNWISLNNQ